MVSLNRMSTARNTLEELLAKARQLPADEQQQLVARLQADKAVTLIALISRAARTSI